MGRHFLGLFYLRIAELVHNNQAHFDLSLWRRIQENIPVDWSVKDPEEETSWIIVHYFMSSMVHLVFEEFVENSDDGGPVDFPH